MKLGIYTVHDAATMAYMQPFFARANGEALRSFASAVNEEGHSFNRHAADYTLFRIGEYDDSTGKIDACAPVSLGSALEYRTVTPSVGAGAQMDITDALREARRG